VLTDILGLVAVGAGVVHAAEDHGKIGNVNREAGLLRPLWFAEQGQLDWLARPAGRSSVRTLREEIELPGDVGGRLDGRDGAAGRDGNWGDEQRGVEEPAAFLWARGAESARS
jgi:hypothetical protein